MAGAIGSAAGQSEVSAFDQAIEQGNFEQAATLYGKLFDARLPGDGKPRADADLDAMAGRILLLMGALDPAQAFLDIAAAGTSSPYAHSGLPLAEAQFLRGRFAEAERSFRTALAKDKGNARAQVGLAQTLLAIRPGEAEATLAVAKPTDPGTTWRQAYVATQIALLHSNVAAARTSLARAQSLSPRTPITYRSAVQTAILAAAVELVAGQRDALVSQLSLLPVSDKVSVDNTLLLANHAPLCANGALSPDDWIVLTKAQLGEFKLVSFAPVAVSRPAAIKPFMESLKGVWQAADGVVDFGAPLVRVRCRVSPPSSRAATTFETGADKWFAERFLRPRFLAAATYGEEDSLTEAARAFDAIEAKTGKNSPILDVLRSELFEITVGRAVQSGDIPPGRIEQQYAALKENILRQNPPFAPMYHVSGETQQQAVARIVAALKLVPVAYAAGAASQMLQSETLAPGHQLQIADTVLARRQTLAPEDWRYVAMRRIELLRQMERTSEVPSSAATYGFPPDLCKVQTSMPVLTDGGIVSGDYPRDAATADLTGATIFEFDIDATSAIKTRRVIAETPPLVFDPSLAIAAPKIRYAAARDGKGKPVACRALTQNVRWQLPVLGDFTPSFDFSTSR